MWRDDALLLDIVLAASDARSFVENMTYETFLISCLHQNAVIRALEIVGEAASKHSSDFTVTRPNIPRRDIINMRHRLIHAYGDVRLDLVWNVTRDKLPHLIAPLTPLIPPAL